MLVILNNIRSAHNVGSIFRTADAFGVEKLFLAGITPTPLDRFGRTFNKLTKVSLGAEKSVPWEQVNLITKLLHKIKKRGYLIIALEQNDKSVPLEKWSLEKSLDKVALILGSETEGLSPRILRHADQIVEIPMHGQKESLNVSVAFGIAMFAINSRAIKTDATSGPHSDSSK